MAFYCLLVVLQNLMISHCLGLSGETHHKINVLFVIAHPDDESIFFSPTINYLTANAYNIHILCLSTGNMPCHIFYTKLYDQHKSFLCHDIIACKMSCIRLVQYSGLDGFGQVWSHDLLTEIISEEVISHDIHTIMTFDSYGVSGHCNHRDVHRGVVKFLQTNSERNIKAWQLVSLNTFRKYCGPIDIWLSILSAKRHRSKVIIINEQPLKSYEAMAQHLSQWVWFRKLFVSFSSYTYTNTLQRINP
ncbi:hypothetical protein HID58_082503 [Brassica napus]|uniref:N-acetylglucosaminylphosphatidylinositol deacetylase n=1 Tax=Brassica napus TaxID=3708 RepID=A0ABQ7YAU5_BRANA|nr:hypothetical protein HID58_082503 [Brassica napus]